MHQYDRIYSTFFRHSPYQYVQLDINFALDLLCQQDLSEPVVISPTAIFMSCTSLTFCTRGKTKKQIEKALPGYGSSDFSDDYKMIINLYHDMPTWSAQLDVSNFIFVRKDLKDSHYPFSNYAAVVVTDLDDKQAAAEEINDEISIQTGGQITNIITPDNIENDFGAIVANGTKFSAQWKDAFNPEETKSGIFSSSADTARSTSFLCKEWPTKFAQDDFFQVVRIDFYDDSFFLAILLPRKQFGLKEAIQQMTRKNLYKLFRDFETQPVRVKIPRFKIESTLELKETLKQIGIRRIFKPNKAQIGTDLPLRKKIQRFFRFNSSGETKFVSQMRHKAVLEITEMGANPDSRWYDTRPESREPSSSTEAINFDANHPFLFMVVKDGHPIMIGVYN